MKKLLFLLLTLLFLAACAPQSEPLTDPEPQPPATEVTPDPVPIPEPTALSYTVGETTKNAQYDGLQVNITLPVLTGENQSALDVINNYYTLLAGKVLDYAEGDLVSVPGTSSQVVANYDLTYATENTVSILWQITTLTTAESPTEFTQSAGVFDVKTGNLYTFSDVFGESAAAVRKMFVEKLRGSIPMMAESNYFYEHWYDLADSSFDPNNFYLNEEGVFIFYPQDALGTAVDAFLSYGTLAEYLAIEP